MSKGWRLLSVYREHVIATASSRTKEVSLRVLCRPEWTPTELPLTGKLDRLVDVDDNGVVLQVVDYKTGKPSRVMLSKARPKTVTVTTNDSWFSTRCF
ncbi:MAG: PD-(D/E)XK nuclease family protein [Candidatus Paceibacterota bacterium]